MSKKVGGVLLSLALMAPCVFLLGLPFCVIAISRIKDFRAFKDQHPDGQFSIAALGIGFDAGGQELMVGALIGALLLLFIVGVVLLIRNSLGDRKRE